MSKKTEIDIVRLMLVKNIGWFITEWQLRPFGADRSDLVEKLAMHLIDGTDEETNVIQTPIRSKDGFKVWIGTNMFSWLFTRLIKPKDYKE